MSDEKLVALCETFGLDSSGRTKHLRERLIDYLEGKPAVPEGKPAEEREVTHPCPDCGEKLSYIEQYDRWYCYSCEKYTPLS